jgi:hypothetical protein
MASFVPSAAFAAAGILAAASHASTTPEVIVDQTANPGNGVASQVFGDFTTYTCSGLDDFTIAGQYQLGTLTVLGVDNGSSSAKIDVIAEVRSSASLDGPSIALVHGTQVGADLVFDMSSVTLVAGTYWISAQVVRDYGAGGQWYWRSNAGTISGSAAMWQNPGGGFGYGTGPVDAGVPLGTGSTDLAWSLTGTAVPGPAGLGAFALAAMASRRRR